MWCQILKFSLVNNPNRAILLKYYMWKNNEE